MAISPDGVPQDLYCKWYADLVAVAMQASVLCPVGKLLLMGRSRLFSGLLPCADSTSAVPFGYTRP